jgi:hypothetical protein
MMKPGDLVRKKITRNAKSGLYLGTFVGMRTFKSRVPARPDYTCAEVYWHDKMKVGTIQKNLLEAINESR